MSPIENRNWQQIHEAYSDGQNCGQTKEGKAQPAKPISPIAAIGRARQR